MRVTAEFFITIKDEAGGDAPFPMPSTELILLPCRSDASFQFVFDMIIVRELTKTYKIRLETTYKTPFITNAISEEDDITVAF